MFQVDNASSVLTQPTPATPGTPGWFTNGNPGTGAPPTIVGADFLNGVQGEFINLLGGAGIAPNKNNNTQVLQAIASGRYDYVVDTGTANTYVGTLLNGTGGFPNANLTLTDGLLVRLKVANVNTGTSTFNLNGLGARAITLRGSPLIGGELIAGDFYTLQYDLANTAWRVTSPVAVRNSVFTASAVTAGTANAQTIATVTPGGYALAFGNVINFTAGVTNTASATLNISGTGAIGLKKNSGTGLIDIVAGDLTNGNSYSVNYNGAFYVLISSSPILTGYLVASNNLSDVASAATARANIGAAKSGANTDITSLAGVTIDSSSTNAARRAFTQQNANYTLALVDAGTMIISGGATAQTFTIPLNSAVAFPLGTEIEFVQLGAGALTISGQVGTDIRARGGLTTLYAQNSAASIKKLATDTWIIIGDLR